MQKPADMSPLRKDKRPTLSVLIPVFNERATVEELIRRVRRVPIDKELIIVDDGSTDGTREILERIERDDPSITLIQLPNNQGKGAAVRRAIERATGRITIIQDADLEYYPDDYLALIEPIAQRRSKVVYGSRPRHPDNEYPLDVFRVGSFVLTMLTNVLYLCWLTDEPTCYKVFDTDLLKSIPLKCRGFEFCPEITAKVRKRGEKIVEVPIRYDKRSVEEGKKINWKDGVYGIWTLLKHRLVD